MTRTEDKIEAIKLLNKEISTIFSDPFTISFSKTELDKYVQLTNKSILSKEDRLIVLGGLLLREESLSKAHMIFRYAVEIGDEENRIGVYAAWLSLLDQIYYDRDSFLDKRLSVLDELVKVSKEALEVCPKNCGIALNLGRIYLYHHKELGGASGSKEFAHHWLTKSLDWSLEMDDLEVGKDARLLLEKEF